MILFVQASIYRFILNPEYVTSDGKFPEIFTGGNFPETFPTMFAHRFLVAYFLTVLPTLASFYDVTLHYL
jgi:hypothetical protein